MPTARSAVPLAAAALLLVLSGCSAGDDAGAPPDAAPASAPGSPAAGDGTVSTEQETCARVIEAARSAPQRLREDPLALLEEFAALADTAPAELSGQIREVRDAVEGFRQGERRLTEVIGEVRELQQRCSA